MLPSALMPGKWPATSIPIGALGVDGRVSPTGKVNKLTLLNHPIVLQEEAGEKAGLPLPIHRRHRLLASEEQRRQGPDR